MGQPESSTLNYLEAKIADGLRIHPEKPIGRRKDRDNERRRRHTPQVDPLEEGRQILRMRRNGYTWAQMVHIMQHTHQKLYKLAAMAEQEESRKSSNALDK